MLEHNYAVLILYGKHDIISKKNSNQVAASESMFGIHKSIKPDMQLQKDNPEDNFRFQAEGEQNSTGANKCDSVSRLEEHIESEGWVCSEKSSRAFKRGAGL